MTKLDREEMTKLDRGEIFEVVSHFFFRETTAQ